ncbi:DJ-1/PfpI family protein, partial [Escherichia coli]|nr:DJ-1/PfpI family protein [Escherichia coli]
MRRIGFLVFPGCSLLDFTGPLTAFDVANRLAPQPAYRIDVLSEGGAQVQSAPGLVMQTQGLDDPAFDTLVISGGNGPREDAFSPRLIAFVRAVAARDD